MVANCFAPEKGYGPQGQRENGTTGRMSNIFWLVQKSKATERHPKVQLLRPLLCMPNNSVDAKDLPWGTKIPSSDVVDDDDCNPVCKLCAA